jgi:hypothetical protein
MKKIAVWTSAFIIGVYTTFVAQCFWNWFAVPILPVSPISFLQMFGIIMFISFLNEKDDSVEEFRWEGVYKALDACLPESKKQEFEEFIEEKQESVWTDAGLKVFKKFFSNTIALIFGFVISALI